jgi:tetratricopeptide (TPR) repeat protein
MNKSYLFSFYCARVAFHVCFSCFDDQIIHSCNESSKNINILSFKIKIMKKLYGIIGWIFGFFIFLIALEAISANEISMVSGTVATNNSSPDYWAMKGVDLANAGKYIEAIRYFNEAILLGQKDQALYKEDPSCEADDLYPQYLWILNARGLAYMKTGDYESARWSFLDAADVESHINNTTASDYYSNAALADFSHSGFSSDTTTLGLFYQHAAADELDDALSYNPNNAKAWYIKGLNEALDKYPDYEAAATYFSKARTLGYSGEVSYAEERTYEETAPLNKS